MLLTFSYGCTTKLTFDFGFIIVVFLRSISILIKEKYYAHFSLKILSNLFYVGLSILVVSAFIYPSFIELQWCLVLRRSFPKELIFQFIFVLFENGLKGKTWTKWQSIFHPLQTFPPKLKGNQFSSIFTSPTSLILIRVFYQTKQKKINYYLYFPL